MTKLILSDEEVKDGCGLGHGATCCKFLLRGGEGWLCGRETEWKNYLIHVEGYCAQRLPTEPYPQCQLAGVKQ